MNPAILVLVCLCILALFFQKSKILTCIIFFFIWTLAWTRLQPDYVNYEIMYNLEINKDLGYYGLSLLFKKIGFDYFSCRLIILAAGWSIYLWFIIKFARRCSLVAALYLCTVSFYDTEQNRNFFGFALCLIGISALFKDYTVKGLIKFGFWVLLGTSMHSMNFFFFVFGLLNKNVLKRVSKVQLVLIAAFFAGALWFLFSQVIIDKIEAYDLGVSSLTKNLLIILFIVNIIFIIFVRKFRLKSSITKTLTISQKKYSISENNILYFNLALFALLPAAFYSLSALRVYRYMEILNLSYVTDKLASKWPLTNIGLNFLIILYGASFGIVAYLMHSSSYWDVVLPEFYANEFYAWISAYLL
ncbi:MAG: EpsG family protein [Muribaculaceae bacterium]|nr:EpsG family protein [Muribaculaceae bacterium]